MGLSSFCGLPHTETVTMTPEIKKKITEVVKQYTTFYPEEFAAFKKQMADTQYKLNDPYGQTKGDNVITRVLVDMPETLFVLIKLKLTDDEFKKFTEDDSSKTSPGQRWFARTFPAFRVTKDV